jgi:hypothetical protein
MSKAPAIVGYECRHATYSRNREHQDIHFVKEVIHYDDGTTKPNTRIIKNFKRSVYVTKKGAQNHKSKKEWEDLVNLNEFKCTQAEMQSTVARALGTPWFRGSMRQLQDSPYVYGTDIDSTALVKQKYIEKYPTLNTPYTVAVFDTETDVVSGDKNKEIIMATVSFKDRVFTCVNENFVKRYHDPIQRIKELAKKYIGDTIDARKINLEIKLVPKEIDIVIACMEKAHQWKPDFLAVWNVDFDMTKILAACERAGVDPKDILNDPSVPEEYRYFNYRRGPAKKITASGVVQVFKPAQRWHTVESPASFYWIDAMCAYRQIRQGSQEEQSYALDYLLNKHLKISKLKFTQADAYRGLQWHQFMQAEYPLEYTVYNVFDCVSMELLEEKTTDLSISLPMYSGCSDFSRFNSQPRRTVDDLHNFCLENGKVIASTSSKMKDDSDDLTAELSDWIVMLPSNLVTDSGLKIVDENPHLPTAIRAHTSD